MSFSRPSTFLIAHQTAQTDRENEDFCPKLDDLSQGFVFATEEGKADGWGKSESVLFGF